MMRVSGEQIVMRAYDICGDLYAVQIRLPKAWTVTEETQNAIRFSLPSFHINTHNGKRLLLKPHVYISKRTGYAVVFIRVPFRDESVDALIDKNVFKLRVMHGDRLVSLFDVADHIYRQVEQRIRHLIKYAYQPTNTRSRDYLVVHVSQVKGEKWKDLINNNSTLVGLVTGKQDWRMIDPEEVNRIIANKFKYMHQSCVVITPSASLLVNTRDNTEKILNTIARVNGEYLELFVYRELLLNALNYALRNPKYSFWRTFTPPKTVFEMEELRLELASLIQSFESKYFTDPFLQKVVESLDRQLQISDLEDSVSQLLNEVSSYHRTIVDSRSVHILAWIEIVFILIMTALWILIR